MFISTFPFTVIFCALISVPFPSNVPKYAGVFFELSRFLKASFTFSNSTLEIVILVPLLINPTFSYPKYLYTNPEKTGKSDRRRVEERARFRAFLVRGEFVSGNGREESSFNGD